MADKILLRRGLYADLPNLDTGELGYVTDHGTLYLGTADSSNILINPVRVVVDGYEIDGYFKPSADNTFGLGTPDKRWKNISVGPGSVHIISRNADGSFLNKNFKLGISSTGKLQIIDGTAVAASFDSTGASFPLGIEGIASIAALDGYAKVLNTAATGDGYIAFFTGIGRSLAGDNDLFYNRATGNLTLGGSGTYNTVFRGAQANPTFNVGSTTGIFLDENSRLGFTIGGTQFWHMQSSTGILSTTAGATILAAQGNSTIVAYGANSAANTGIFFPGSTSMAIATSGSEAARFVDGRLGIGITAPSASLHVAGDGYFDGYLMPFAEGQWGLGATQKRWHSLNLGKGGLYVQDAGNIFLGENISLGSRISPSSNLSQLVLGLGAQHNRHIIIGMSEFANRDYDKGGSDPTLYIHSITNPDVSNTEYLSLSHTTTKAKIFAGNGILNIGTDATSDHSLTTGDIVFGGQIEVNSSSWFDGIINAVGGIRVNDGSGVFSGAHIRIGNTDDAMLFWNTSQTPDALTLGIGHAAGPESRAFIICERDDIAVDFAHPSPTNPTIFLHAGDATNLNKWIGFAHDQSDGYIFAAHGNLKVSSASGNLVTFDTSGPALRDVASSATIPTLIPNRASLTAGVGGTGGDVSLITSGAERINIDTAGTASIVSALQLNDDVPLYIGPAGGGPGTHALWRRTSQTVDGVMLGLATGARLFLIVENGDEGTDFGHANPVDPTLVIQSSNSASPTQWISLSHNQTAGVIATGSGHLSLGAFTGTGHGLGAGDVAVSGQFETNATAWIDAGAVFSENNAIWLGGPTGGTNSAIFPESTRGQLSLMVGSAHGYHLVFGSSGVIASDFGHASQVHPTIFVHSELSPSADNTQWLSLFHTQDDGYIETGRGDISLDPDGYVGILRPPQYTHIQTSGDLFFDGGSFMVGVTNTVAPRSVYLPRASTVTNNFYVIKDLSGGAGANNITVRLAHSGDTIDGAATAVINANYGVLRVWSKGGTQWFTW